MARETIEHRKACECDAGMTLVESPDPSSLSFVRHTPVCDGCGTPWRYVGHRLSIEGTFVPDDPEAWETWVNSLPVRDDP